MNRTYDDQWTALAASALLGTDRRDSPPALGGPMAAFESSLDQVAALAVVRRAGVRPVAVARQLIAVPADDRPICRLAASRRLEEVIEQWPVLIDEWLWLASLNGWRLAPESVPGLLIRFRTDSRRRVEVVKLAGPLAEWLIDLDLAPVAGGRSTNDDPTMPPVPADLAPLWDLDGTALAVVLCDGLSRGQFANRHRPLLVRLLCDIPSVRIAPVADALSRAATNAATMGLALSLGDLARVRTMMIEELLP